MSGRIPTEFIDALLARTDIVDVIGTRVALKKAGKDYQARCPFHDEKTPSFTVSPEKQFYHCFGCGAHGTAIGFLLEHDRLSFREAIEELAQRAGLEVPVAGASSAPGPDLQPLYDLHEQVRDLYRDQLRQHPSARRAVEYLKARGLSGAIAAHFGIGFAPAGGQTLIAHFAGNLLAREQLLASGLIVDQDGRRHDRFRDRIIFPIRDRRGRVIGFGGRLLGEGKPKYLNSPESPIFHKGRELYGLYEAQQANRRPDSMLVVEGYLDTIALAQYGLTNVVATLGTATTTEHLQLLARSAPEIVFCFDGDRAGRDAAWKALQTTLGVATGRQSYRFLFLPEGEDPDTLVRVEGAAAFQERMRRAQPLSDYFFEHLCAQVDLTSIEGRARLATLAQPLIEPVPPGVYRDMLNARLAELTGLKRLGSGPPSSGAPARPPVRARGRGRLPQPRRPSRIAMAIALLLDNPSLAPQAEQAPGDWRRASNPGIAILVELLETLADNPNMNKATLLERFRENAHFGHLQRLSIDPVLRDIPQEGIAAEFIGALTRLSEDIVKDERSRPMNETSPAAWSEDVRAQVEQQAAAARTRRR
ncbi:DNA primase [Thiocapsa imhoffii]|uniref:DNA primase n=1 Tax=Thiocapsa imhoffii TaxID=382777 RepID=A0A9X0WH78_9GAMM|nr:DNA primase [Thiocapsa imhoffii]MBK1644550.1 DNA primase [Thiocapsa imhoffii]